MWIFRSHRIETPFTSSYKQVTEMYTSKIDDGVLPTRLEIEELLDRIMNNRTEDATFSFQVPNVVADASAVQDSMETYYLNMKKGKEVQCVGRRTRKMIRCVVCMNSKGTKIKLSCGHIFHRKCIEEWARWKTLCPTCNKDIALKV